MVTISNGKVMLIIFVLSFACAIIAIATDGSVFNTSSSMRRAYGAFLIIAIISLGIVIILELLLNFVSSIKDNRIVQTVSIVLMVLAGIY